ncbi:MAG TPA: hypothetical protein VHF67_06830 [Gaiellaceae bacterium]|nr:hypothetical protein [Gaiellaceae bacterium]
MVGDQDFADFRAIADRLAADVAGARQAVIEDAAHMLALKRPTEIRHLLDEFLAPAA